MQKLVLSVTLEDDTHFDAIRVLPGDVVRLERHFKLRAGDLPQVETLEHNLFLAWAALTRKKLIEVEFDEFCDVVAEIDFVSSEAAVPSSPAP